MAQVKINTNVYCQQTNESQVDLVYVNSLLASVNVQGMLSDIELYQLGNSLLKLMEQIPAAQNYLSHVINTNENDDSTILILVSNG